ncbi:MAG: acetyl/propionyl/methylcrotonyl-CoA carboxylase subunit alpha [Rhodobacteraceae bacterium]|nr:acetyl/propionyl/methylcrotonyl-CoA carboxylase subunit alpha [Paracoccaceae bacterium]
MFTKILIANRGEIACRVITTARKLGILTVAVHSDADVDAQHVALADEAVHIGPPAVAESYLRGDRIIKAALETGAEAIHPGYGFLSENPDFVDAVTAAGLVFIGPSASAIRAMGLKDAAKALMVEAGVPVVPGYHGDSQDADFLAQEADKIGYPVLIKARAGGGGKGMRLVEDPADFKAALAGAQREGQASFGDPVCLIEKYITQPRHIEIQIFGDSHGNVLHMFERDCSLQRRHQKVIEEAPAPEMPEQVREAMGRAAVEAAMAIQYTGAGTVEFIVDGSGPLREDGFWFMEMNTRLQVEHPVSEAITGLDFVELQLRVAFGDPLPMTQQDLSINGWSFEARLYAEDVPKGFLPATGILEHLVFPAAAAFELGSIRVDSGVVCGDEISPWYDPMIAKIIVHGPTRATALNTLSQALARTEIAGLTTNHTFLRRLARHPSFAQGKLDTGLIAREAQGLIPAPVPCTRSRSLAALAALGLDSDLPELAGYAHWAPVEHPVRLVWADESLQAKVWLSGNARHVTVDGVTHVLQPAGDHGDQTDRWWIDGTLVRARVQRMGRRVSVFWGNGYHFDSPDPLAVQDDHAGGDVISAPMPGLVKLVSATAGADVMKGDALLVLEAMKMEHTLVAPRDGVVSEVLTAVGDQVTDGTVLLTLLPVEDPKAVS